MLVGYARVSTQDQDPALQLDALKGAGCGKVFTEKASGAQRERPQLRAALDYMRSGDTLVVWKLDRLARSLKQLIETVEDLGDRGIGLRSLTESIDTGSTGGRLVFHIFAALAEFSPSRAAFRRSFGWRWRCGLARTTVFQHFQNKYLHPRPADCTFYAGIMALGCNIGIHRIIQ